MKKGSRFALFRGRSDVRKINLQFDNGKRKKNNDVAVHERDNCERSGKHARGWSFFVVVDGCWIYNTARIKFWRYIFSSGTHHIAYFRVHSRASSLYFSRSVLYILAISGTSGSSGLGSQRREQIDNNTKTKKRTREALDKCGTLEWLSSYLLKLLVQVTIEILVCRDKSTHYC